MKRIFILALIILFSVACGKKSQQPPPRDLWFQNASFIKSVQLSDAEGVVGIISTTGIDLNAPDEHGRSALLFAIETTQNETLIAAIAEAPSTDLNFRDNLGRAAITLAAMFNPNEEVLLALIMAGANVPDANALLDYAYKNPNIAVPGMVGKLIMKTPWDKSAAFIEALQKDDYKTLRRLMPFTDIINSAAPQKSAPLHIALTGNSREIILLLVANGADVNQYVVPQQKITPLHYAAANRPLIIIDALIKAGADINAQDINGMTPLMAAVKMHQDGYKASALLLKNKADFNIVDNNGDTALAIAALNNKTPDNILALIQAGADINSRNKKGYTPLLLAAAFNREEIITEVLLREKADMSAVNEAGFTALAIAAQQNPNEKVTQALIAHGADFNVKTPQGFTPLMLAVSTNENEKIAQALINAEAEAGDVQILLKYAEENKNSAVKEVVKQLLPPEPEAPQQPQNSKSKKAWYNNDAFSDAVAKGDVKALKQAISQGVNIKVMYAGARSVSALMHAIAHTQNEGIISTLIQEGADVNASNENGDTALMVAAMITKNPKIIEVLAKAGADMNAKDLNGVSALMSAAANNPEESIIRALLAAGADTKNITALIEAASKNPNPKIKELFKQAH